MHTIRITTRELHFVLAALRLLQDHDAPPHHVREILTNGGQCRPLADEEIESLCERVNFCD